MVQPDSGTRATASEPSDLEKYFIHTQADAATGHIANGRFWGEPTRGYSGVQHNNANRKKKAKRKQAQTSRRKNRR